VLLVKEEAILMRYTTIGALDAQEGIMTPCTFTVDYRVDILRKGLERKF
jgi:hypothetical protein